MASIRHSELFAFFSRLLPEEQLLYHSPLPPTRPYDPTRTNFQANRVVLSLTPTEGVYAALRENPRQRCVLFMHRPFRLDRSRVPHGTLVLQSHVRYDELLTTGWNTAFADENLVSHDERRCIKGYKDNPERRIGLVGKLSAPISAKDYAQRLSSAFRGHDELYLPEPEELQVVHALASLNAFTPEVLERVASSASELGVLPAYILCLTGAVRDAGMEDAKRRGFAVLAVGHKRCEDWGMAYIEKLLRKEFGGVEIVRVDEPEEVLEKKQPLEQHKRGTSHPPRQDKSRRGNANGRHADSQPNGRGNSRGSQQLSVEPEIDKGLDRARS